MASAFWSSTTPESSLRETASRPGTGSRSKNRICWQPGMGRQSHRAGPGDSNGYGGKSAHQTSECECQPSAGRTSSEVREQNQTCWTAYPADLHDGGSTCVWSNRVKRDRCHRRGKEKLGWYFATLASWATLFHGSPKNNRMERFVPPLRSVRRMRSHRMKFCVQKGAWGHCPQQADGRQCECVLTLALLARCVCGYLHALLACRIWPEINRYRKWGLKSHCLRYKYVIALFANTLYNKVVHLYSL